MGSLIGAAIGAFGVLGFAIYHNVRKYRKRYLKEKPLTEYESGQMKIRFMGETLYDGFLGFIIGGALGSQWHLTIPFAIGAWIILRGGSKAVDYIWGKMTK